MTSSSTYRPSRELAARVQELERDALLELKGIVHSHPRGMDHPSDQDARELATGLRLNGHMPCYLAPIVTEHPPEDALGRHELPLGGAKISFFAAWRSDADAADVAPVRVLRVPLLEDLERVARAWNGSTPEVFSTDLGAGTVPAGRIAGPEGELLVVAHEQYPTMPPVVLFTPPGGETEQLHLPWPVQRPLAERLAPSVAQALAARAADRGALFARTAGLLTPALRERRVLVAGCGSVGSYVAEQLTRSGVGALELLDPDTVSAENLSRSAYDAGDVGCPKVEALAARLRRIAPGVRVTAQPRGVETFEPAALDAVVRAADLVVAATDDPIAQRALDRFAYGRGKPALFIGLYAAARGGEVILTDAERTACYQCATRIRHAAEASGGRVARAVDYGTGRLQGEVALGADVQHVASAGVKLALSLLVRGHPDAALGAFAEEIVRDGATYLTMSTVARYWFYPDVFGATAGQGAYQSVWLTPARGEDCPVCGSPDAREDPLDVPLRPPGRDAFAAVDRAE